MVTLNTEIDKLDLTSKLGILYVKLRDGMLNAQKAELPSQPDISTNVNELGEIDSQGQQLLDQYTSDVKNASEIMMKNSAYNTAKSIIESLGGEGGSISIFTYTRNSSTISDEDAITSALNSSNPKEGNIVLITDTNTDGTIEYGISGFVYKDAKWATLCGRVDASRVIMRGEMILSGNYTSVGNITKGSDSSTATLSVDGLSVMDVMNKIFSKVMEPSVTQPYISSLSVKANSASGSSSVEIGTKIYPYWKANFNSGSYSYNNTEVSVLSCEVIDGNGVLLGSNQEGTGNTQVQITESPYSIKLTVNYSDGAVPVTNMKEPSTQVSGIKAGSVNKTSSISSYRNMFYGYTSADTFDSTTLRSMTRKPNSSISLSFDENKDYKKIIFAAPKGTRNITKVIMPSSSNAEVTAEFVKQATPVQVAGENGYLPIDYDIWVYQPAVMAGTYNLTIS